MAKLKPCPFCGGLVVFDPTIAVYNVTIRGKCQECGMVFEYQEEHEQYKLERCNGDLPVVTYFNHYVRLNAPFEDAWNRRAENEELKFTREFIHEHGLEFALADAWTRRAK